MIWLDVAVHAEKPCLATMIGLSALNVDTMFVKLVSCLFVKLAMLKNITPDVFNGFDM